MKTKTKKSHKIFQEEDLFPLVQHVEHVWRFHLLRWDLHFLHPKAMRLDLHFRPPTARK